MADRLFFIQIAVIIRERGEVNSMTKIHDRKAIEASSYILKSDR